MNCNALLRHFSLMACAALPLIAWSQPAGNEPVPHITADNWYWGPANRWSWMNTRRLFPSANLSRGSGPVAALPQAHQDLSNITFDDPISHSRLTVAKMLESTYTDGFLVLKDGRVVTEQYFNGLQPNSPHLLMSMTKSVVGTLTGILIARGQIRAEAQVTEYLPELKGTVFDNAAVRNLLDMTVAAKLDDDPYDAIDRASGWLPPKANSAPGLRAFLRTLNHKDGQHGRKFLYLDPSPQVMCWIIERVTHKDFAQVLQDEIWSKLGAENDAYVLLDHYQEAYTTPGINITLRDMGRFGQMMVQDGSYNAQQIVPRAWVADIRAGGDPQAWLAAKQGRPPEPEMPGHAAGSYRDYWWMADRKCGRYTAIGLGEQLMIVDPIAHMVIVKFSSTPDAEAGERLTLTAYYAADAIIRALSGHGC